VFSASSAPLFFLCRLRSSAQKTVNYIELIKKPSLEIAPTVLTQKNNRQTANWLAITYLKFQIQVCFLVRCHYRVHFLALRCGFPNYTFIFQSNDCSHNLKKNIFISWPQKLTYDLDLRNLPKQSQDEPACQISRSMVILFENNYEIDVQSDTHTPDPMLYLDH